jgi:hypothetical protein
MGRASVGGLWLAFWFGLRARLSGGGPIREGSARLQGGMPFIDWLSIHADCGGIAAPIIAPQSVVMPDAQRLQFSTQEHAAIAIVRHFVVGDSCRRVPTLRQAYLAQRLNSQLMIATSAMARVAIPIAPFLSFACHQFSQKSPCACGVQSESSLPSSVDNVFVELASHFDHH